MTNQDNNGVNLIRMIADSRGITEKQVRNALAEVRLHPPTGRPGRGPAWAVALNKQMKDLTGSK